MKRTALWILISICLSTAVAAAAVGELKYIPYDPRTMRLKMTAPAYFYTRSVSPAPAGCGTVHPKAVVGTLKAGSTTVKIAFDAAQADAEVFDTARVDFTGQGSFAKAPAAPLKVQRSTTYVRYTIGPATLQLSRGSRTMPVFLSGYYYTRSYQRSGKPYTYHYLRLYVGAAAEGSCRFGEKVYGVRVIDASGNARVGDAAKVTIKDGKVQGLQYGRFDGDMVLIDTSGQTFRTAAIEVPCGQRVRVNDAWYEIGVSDEGKITAAPVKVPTGTIAVPHGKWEVTLIGTKHILMLSGGKAPVEVPADRYVAANYREFALDADGSQSRAVLMAGRRVMYGQAGKTFDVRAGETTTVPVGSPLTVRAKVTSRPGSVYFSAVMRDAGGTQVDYLYGPNGRRPEAPTVRVYGADGKQVYSGKMRYG